MKDYESEFCKNNYFWYEYLEILFVIKFINNFYCFLF